MQQLGLGLGELVPVVAEVAGVAVGVQDGVWFRVAAEQGEQQEVADKAASGEAMGGGRVLEEKEAEGTVRECEGRCAESGAEPEEERGKRGSREREEEETRVVQREGQMGVGHWQVDGAILEDSGMRRREWGGD